jgi:hypothetical protein
MALSVAVTQPALAQSASSNQWQSKQPEVSSPLTTAFAVAMADRAAKGLPMPASVTYESGSAILPMINDADNQSMGSNAGKNEQPSKRVISSTIVIHYDSPAQAGYQTWPEGEAAASAGISSLSVEAMRMGPRTYTLHEMYEVYESPTYVQPQSLVEETYTNTFDLLMGATYQGPRYRESFTQRCVIEGDIAGQEYSLECGFISFSMSFDSHFGTRFPMQLIFNGPAQPDAVDQGRVYSYTAFLQGRDWNEIEYARKGIEPMGGHEIGLEFALDAGLKMKAPGSEKQ